MTISLAANSAAGTTVLTVTGRIDSATSGAFGMAAQAVPDSRLIVDMRGVTYVSSAGLRAILMAAKVSGRDLALIGLQPGVAKVFEASGFGTIFPIMPDEAAARARQQP